MARDDGDKWREAYESEMDSILEHGTYSWEPLPEGKSLVKGKLIFTKKPARDGKPER
jgi:hypothetical protein